MSNPISTQAHKLWQLLSAPSTASAYGQALSVTWTILKETALLLWLVLCLVLVAFDWFWHRSIAAGQRTRAWVDSLSAQDTNQMASRMGQGILAASQTSLQRLVAQARTQLNLPAQPLANPPVVTTPSTASSIAVVKPATAAPASDTPASEGVVSSATEE
ncbi:MAG: hypothetical protein IGS38_24520 [Synechococcales cyanobacterium M58_A2018_015]|nr:hypothetical protein [Synechococcales cyanobacterium M58_A2018_015]